MTMTGKIIQGKIELHEPLDLPEGTEVQVDLTPLESSFWSNLSADELARRQKLQPIKSVDDLAGDWPPEDSIDELLKMVREVRR